MDVAFWVCNVHTGDVVDRLPVAGGWSLTNRFGGGTASWKIPLGHLRTKSGDDWDWPYIEHIHSLVEPGDYSILATWGDKAVGEWVITGSRPSSDGDVLEVTGDEWEMYFAERSTTLGKRVLSDDMYSLARLMFERVFVTAKVVPIAVNVPQGNAGVTKAVETLPRSETYADLMRKITDSNPVMEWRIEAGVTWTGGQPSHAVRNGVFGRPVLARQTSFQAVLAGFGQRSGNVLSVSSGKNWRNWTYQVAGVGAGNGDKRLWTVAQRTYEEYPVKLHRGIISQHSDVEKKSILQSRVAAELDVLSASMGEPYDISLNPARVDDVPRVGEEITLIIERQPAYPVVVTAPVRVGERTITGVADIVETIVLKAA